jgi:hypothetical protein
VGTFFTDFAGDTPGASPAGWSVAGTAFGHVIVADPAASGGKVLRLDSTDNDRKYLICDDVADVADVEVVMKARFSGDYLYQLGVLARFSETVEFIDFAGYAGVADYYSDPAIVTLFLGPKTNLGTQPSFDNKWMWYRLKTVGGWQYFKIWDASGAEPVDWTGARNDTNFPDPGKVGVLLRLNYDYGQTIDIDCFGVGFGGEAAPLERLYPEAEIDATTTAAAEIEGLHPFTAALVAETEGVTASLEATYTLVFAADIGLQADNTASQFEVLHASGILAAVAGNTEGAVATLSLVHVPAIAGAVAALCENAESTITGNLLTLIFSDVDATTADVALVLALSITFDVVAGAVTAPQPSIVGLVGMEFPLNGTAFALRPELDSVLTAEYQSYLQGLVLPAPVAYGTATYELTLQGVT